MKAVLVLLPDFPWRCLMQDDAESHLPTLFGLIERGASGPCPSLGPHPIMDGVIFSGMSPIQSGLLTRTEIRPDAFGVDNASASKWLTPPLWEYFDSAGLRAAIVNLRATTNSQLKHGFVVADTFCEISARTFLDWGIPFGAVSPPDLLAELADIRVHPEDLAAAQIAHFIASGEIARSREREARVAIKTLAENVTAHAAATHLLASKEADFLIVRYPAIAQLKGAFPAPATGQGARGCAWAFLKMLDAFVARLVELSSENTAFLVCGGTEAEPFWIACGPRIQPDCLWPKGTSLYDVAPAMLGLAGLKVPGMRGETPAEISLSDLDEICISPGGNDANDHLDFSDFSDLSSFTPTEPSRSQCEMLVKHEFRTVFALAEVARLESRIDDAIAHYETALHAIPGDRLTLKRLCVCLIGSKRWQEASTRLESLVQSGRDAETIRLEAALEKQFPQ